MISQTVHAVNSPAASIFRSAVPDLASQRLRDALLRHEEYPSTILRTTYGSGTLEQANKRLKKARVFLDSNDRMIHLLDTFDGGRG